MVSHAVRDWILNGFVYYASGVPLSPPNANAIGYPSKLIPGTISNLTFQTGQTQIRTRHPLYLDDLNCHYLDPDTQFVLNPKAWADPARGAVWRPKLLR